MSLSCNTQQISKATRLRNLGQRGRNMLAKAGESDRAIRVKMVRFLVTFFFWKFHLGCPLSYSWTLGVCDLSFLCFISTPT